MLMCVKIVIDTGETGSCRADDSFLETTCHNHAVSIGSFECQVCGLEQPRYAWRLSWKIRCERLTIQKLCGRPQPDQHDAQARRHVVRPAFRCLMMQLPFMKSSNQSGDVLIWECADSSALCFGARRTKR